MGHRFQGVLWRPFGDGICWCAVCIRLGELNVTAGRRKASRHTDSEYWIWLTVINHYYVTTTNQPLSQWYGGILIYIMVINGSMLINAAECCEATHQPPFHQEVSRQSSARNSSLPPTSWSTGFLNPSVDRWVIVGWYYESEQHISSNIYGITSATMALHLWYYDRWFLIYDLWARNGAASRFHICLLHPIQACSGKIDCLPAVRTLKTFRKYSIHKVHVSVPDMMYGWLFGFFGNYFVHFASLNFVCLAPSIVCQSNYCAFHSFASSFCFLCVMLCLICISALMFPS